MMPIEIEAQIVGDRKAFKGDNNFCHIDGEDRKHRYQLFFIRPNELPEIVKALDAADTIIWRYKPAVEIYKNFEEDKDVIRLRFAAIKDGKQVLIWEHKEKKYD